MTIRFHIVLLLISAICISATAQDSIGIIVNKEDAYKGLTLYSPLFTTKSYLIDMEGKEVKVWDSGFKPGAVEYLMPESKLLKASRVMGNNFRISGKGGLIQLINSDNIVEWSYSILDEGQCQHHNILPMPNGNILAIVWERILKEDAIEMGRSPKNINIDVYMLKIIEIKPIGKNDGEIMWEWHAKDHLIQDFDESKQNYGKISEHPELIDFNYVVRDHNKRDYLHANALDYNAELDLIIITIRATDEIWIIDHSTNSDEAANHSHGNYKHGGDLIFRWGNPQVYQNREDTVQTLFGQHDAHWIKDGKYAGDILVFNNGRDSIRPWSSIDIIDIDLPDINKPTISISAKLVWSYEAPTKQDFYSTYISGAQMLPNGNILITEGQKGRIFEINSKKKIVWEFINPHYGSSAKNYQSNNPNSLNFVFKAKRYGGF